jgi:uncharacterized protein YeaO (DUF488 family)
MRMARVYDPIGPDDGTRILVDRLWPRGVHKDDPRVGRWCKTAAKELDLGHLVVFAPGLAGK